mmetsp:Transcript_4845/g.12252  ORF Transcript_4845/g.12252 Transcript_4845/m.12252 type:complete len:157 (+) Transcript_4845:126-596(+)
MQDMRPMPGPGSAFISRPSSARVRGLQSEAPKVEHHATKDVTEDGEPLDRIIQTSRCIRCTSMFKESENADDACHYHPGPSQSFIRNQNHLDRITFLCCGTQQIGFQPVLLPAPCCKVGRHISAEDKKKQQELAKAQRASAVAANKENGGGQVRRR